MRSVIILNKKVGETPLEAIKRFVTENPEYAEVSLTYAGRLDPMAHGVLLVLTGDVIKEKSRFLGLDKTYRAQVLFDATSDTGDILGIIKNCTKKQIQKNILKNKIESMAGELTFTLPNFSSYKVKGKPLFWWARNNRLKEIEIPKRTTTIHSIRLNSLKEKGGIVVKKEALSKITMVNGDFRQKEVLASWDLFATRRTYQIATITVTCSSGTYIRAIAEHIGAQFNTGALLIDLKRISVGDYKI